MRVGILGTGNIANAMATALNGLDDSVIAYACASRTLKKAQEFAQKWNIEKAYGSYEELAGDPQIDLIYIATPHAMHYENAMLCLKKEKNVLVEKAFTANLEQAKALLTYAQEKNLFVTEAIWTRYMPSRRLVEEILKSGRIGELTSIEADFSLPISHIKRMQDPALAGGALLDLGMYTLTFASMFFGDDVVKLESTCKKYKTGVDGSDTITLHYADGKVANLKTSMLLSLPKNYGIIKGTKGSIHIDDINNFSKIQILDELGKKQECVEIPEQINGYEYEVMACQKALADGKKECQEMPHEETLTIMSWMDQLRSDWGIIYPFEKN